MDRYLIVWFAQTHILFDYVCTICPLYKYLIKLIPDPSNPTNRRLNLPGWRLSWRTALPKGSCRLTDVMVDLENGRLLHFFWGCCWTCVIKSYPLQKKWVPFTARKLCTSWLPRSHQWKTKLKPNKLRACTKTCKGRMDQNSTEREGYELSFSCQIYFGWCSTTTWASLGRSSDALKKHGRRLLIPSTTALLHFGDWQPGKRSGRVSRVYTSFLRFIWVGPADRHSALSALSGTAFHGSWDEIQ